MRPILAGDIDYAARVMLATPVKHLHERAREILEAAEAADRYRKETGQLHPQYGGGSVAAACSAFDMDPLPYSYDVSFLHCMAVFCEVAASFLTDRG